MSRLLNKPLNVFAWYALSILICSIPVYYVIIDSIWIEELDEHNQIVKEQTENGFHSLKQSGEDLKNSIQLWNKIRPDARLIAVSGKRKDSVYTATHSFPHNREQDTDRYRGLITYIRLNDQFYQLVIETNIEEADETILAIALITCIFIALLITGFILLNKKISKKVWTPFTDTLEKLKNFDLNHPVSPIFTENDIIEFTELHAVLTKLIDNNLQLYHQQKEFVQNASHELQTPLAILKSKIDLFIQDTSLTQEQRNVIESVAATVSRISRINKNLLLLTEIENKSYTSEQVDVRKLLLPIVDSLKDVSGNRTELALSFTQELLIEGNESLTEILITNLLSNAIRHSFQPGKITIVIQDRSLIIRNTGTEPLKQDMLFKRFSTVSSQTQGTGLGLAIVKEICNKHAWNITYDFLKEEHVFSVKF